MPSPEPTAPVCPVTPATTAHSGRKSPSIAWLAGLLLLGCLLLNAAFLRNPVVFDDGYFFDGVTPLQFGHRFAPLELRWLPYATFGWTQQFLGLDLVWYHLGNVLLHAANVILLMFLLRRLFAGVLRPATPGMLSITACAFAGALLFALHPAAVYAVAYLNQRSTLMAMLFALLSLHGVISFAASGKKRHAWLAIACYGGAVLAKEHIVMLPAVAAALVILLEKPSRALVRKWALPAALCLLIALYAFWQVRLHGVLATAYQSDGPSLVKRTLDTADSGHAWLLSMETQCTLFFKYWLLWLIPNPDWMSVDMFTPFARHVLSWPETAGCFGFVLYGAGAIWLLLKRGQRGLLGFVLLAPWLLFATELSTVRIQEPFVLYRSYLWMAVPVGCLPLLVSATGRNRALFYLGALCLVLIPLSVNRLQSFSHPLLLWDDAVSLAERQPVQPGMERLYYNRGNELMRVKWYQQAIQDYTHAIRIYPQYSYAYDNRGVVYHQLGQERQALADFNTSLAYNIHDARAWWNQGLSLNALGRHAEATASFSQACRRGLRAACQK